MVKPGFSLVLCVVVVFLAFSTITHGHHRKAAETATGADGQQPAQLPEAKPLSEILKLLEELRIRSVRLDRV